MKNTQNPPAQRAFARSLLAALVSALGLFAFSGGAAIPSPEKLLPDDTLVLVTVPDFTKIRELYNTSPQTQLWNDPAMKPFKDHFISKLEENLIQPLEHDLGVQLDDFTNLPQGQVTFALTQNSGSGSGNLPSAFLLLLDTKDKSSQLTTNLSNLKRKWVEAGKSIRTEKIRDIEFSVLPISEQDIPKSLQKLLSSDGGADQSGDDATNQALKNELVIGQYESLLIVGNSTKAVEKVMVHLTGGAMPALGELEAYETCRQTMFRDAPFYGWVNVKALLSLLVPKAANADPGNANAFPMFDVRKILDAFGLSSLKTLAFNVQNSNEGTSVQFSLGVPESGRQGLFTILPGAAKDSGPPPFVPADAVKFQRWRIDGQKAWATLQKIMNDISPN